MVRLTGVIDWMSGNGYGFIIRDDNGEKLFFHQTQLDSYLEDQLTDRFPDGHIPVSFEIRNSNGRDSAIKIQPAYDEVCDEVYNIVSESTQQKGKALSISTIDTEKAHIYPDNGWIGTKWAIRKNDDGSCNIISQHPELNGNVLSISTADNEVRVYPDNGWIGTKWEMRKNDDGTYCFISKHPDYKGQVLSISSADDIARVYPDNGWAGTKWTIHQ